MTASVLYVDPQDAHQEFRPLLFSLAYRMLGSVAEAEDIVQDAYERFFRRIQTLDGGIDSPKAYLSTVVTRLSIDRLASARVRRERYVGSWLPEPLVTEAPGSTPADPAQRVELQESVSMAFLVLLEQLSPVERAVFLLREIFGYDYPAISTMVEKSEANCRQLLVRARRHLDDRKPRFEAAPEARRDVAERFFAAFEQGDLAALLRILAPEVVLQGDGGGKAPALAQPARGALRVARTLLSWMRQGRAIGIAVQPVWVNGQPGALTFDPEGRIINVLALDIADSAIQAVRSIVNPDKLGHLGTPTDFTEILQRDSGSKPSHRHDEA